jgi:hypothetical protein
MRIQLRNVLHQSLVATHENGGHAEHGGGQRVDHVFGGAPAVDTDFGGIMREGVGEAVGLRARGGVIADHHHGIEALVQLLHHAKGMALPRAHEAHVGGQHGRDDVAARGVCILDENLGCARQLRTLDGGDGLARHLLAEFRPVGVVLLDLVPMGRAGEAFHVDADVNLHDLPSRIPAS